MTVAPIHRSNQNEQIYETFMSRARQLDNLMPGHGDRRRVITLQQKLNAVGVSVPVTGSFDYATSTAVRNFKARAGIKEEFLDRQGNYAVSDVMTAQAEEALDQLARQAGWAPTGPLRDRDVVPGWNSRQNYPQAIGMAAPGGGSQTGAPGGYTGSTFVSAEERAWFAETQQKIQRNGYTPNAQERARYDDIRGRMLAQRQAPPSPVATQGQMAPNDPMALLNSRAVAASGPVSQAEAAAADAFEALLAQNPEALDSMPGLMYRNFLTIRARQASHGQEVGGPQQRPSLPATYAVQSGDTFASIGEALGVDPQALYSANADRLAEWQRAHPEITRRFNDYYKTQQVPNPYLLPRGFELAVPGGGAPQPSSVDGPGRTNGSRPSNSSSAASSAPATTWTSQAVDMEQYQWFIASQGAYQANQLSAGDRKAFEAIANKTQVTPELDAFLSQQGGQPTASYGGPTMTIDVSDPDPELQAALQILNKLESGQQVSADERAMYKQLMASYRARTFLGN